MSKWQTLDDTWRLMDRMHLWGQDYYQFWRAGTEPGIAYMIHQISVDQFWGTKARSNGRP